MVFINKIYDLNPCELSLTDSDVIMFLYPILIAYKHLTYGPSVTHICVGVNKVNSGSGMSLSSSHLSPLPEPMLTSQLDA